MYTATIISKSIQRAAKRVVVDVEFTNGTDTFTETFTFGLQVTSDELKRTIKNFAEHLENIQINIELVAPLGVVDLSTVVDVAPTQAEIDQRIWFRNFNRLEQLTKLNTLGALRPALVPDLEALRTTVATDFKKAYIADM